MALWGGTTRRWLKPPPLGSLRISPRCARGASRSAEASISNSRSRRALGSSRLSMATGQYETFELTEVERTASGGVVISSNLWGRDKDQIGIGGVLNGI